MNGEKGYRFTMSETTTPIDIQNDLQQLLTGTITEQQAAIYALGKEAVIFALLTLVTQRDKANDANA